MGVVDARLAGGYIKIAAVQPEFGPEGELVELSLPINVAQLFPDEARRLAVALLEAAADAESPEPPEWP